MNIRALFTDDSAVSPVIGVILMVAITVILAAVIAAFVLGLGDGGSDTPTVTFGYEVDSGASELTVKHVGGDQFNSDRVTFSGTGIDSGDLGTTWTSLRGLSSATRIGAGERVTVDISDPNLEYKLEVVWTSEDGEDSVTISDSAGPVPEGPSP